MLISEANWMQIEAYLRQDDRAVVPLGSTEQHAYLSLSVDTVLAGRVAQEAAAPLGVPVFPTVPYGLTPYFMAYPGTVSLRATTYFALVSDILDSLAQHGFRRIVLVNGHGGNSPVQTAVSEWLALHPHVTVKFHNWWNAPQVWAQVQATDPVASHASWMENFPWTRLADVAMPTTSKPVADSNYLRQLNPQQVRDYLGDGNFAGLYQRPDEEMLAIWKTAVLETRAVIAEGW